MRTWILLCVIAVALSSSVKAAELSPEARECFDWISTLGFPDVKDAPWSEVSEGVKASSRLSVDPHPTHGFIISETDDDFRFLTLDLQDGVYKKDAPELKAFAHVVHQEDAFFEMAKTRLQNLEDDPVLRPRPMRATLGLKGELIFLSFASWRKGNTALAQEIFDAAAKLPEDHHEGPFLVKLTMKVELERELAHAAMWDGVLRFGGDRLGGLLRQKSKELMPRAELLEMFRKMIRLYPNGPYIKRAQEIVAMLEQMVAEDAAHRWLTQEEIAKLPVEKQVEEWIFRLRDQNGHQDSQPGGCDIFDTLRTGRGDGTSPAHQLVKIGYPAVPQLIETLSDERFTRSVGYMRDFFFSDNILRVSDCAYAILERIAGQRFPNARPGEEWHQTDMASTRNSVQAWWKVARVMGEKQALIDVLSSGKEWPLALVLRMREKYPDAVTDALFQGARNASQRGIAEDYIILVGEIKSEAATDVLLEKLNTHSFVAPVKKPVPSATDVKLEKLHAHDELGIRMEAAVQLMNRNHPAGLNAALNECINNRGTALDDPFYSNHTPFDLLIASGNADAMREVVKGWDQRTVPERLRIIMKIGRAMKPHEGKYVARELVVKPLEKEAKNLAITLLAHALEDTAVYEGYGGSFGDYKFRDPRICDITLWELHSIQPDVYAFSSQASPEQRDAERISAANQWRREHGEPEISK